MEVVASRSLALELACCLEFFFSLVLWLPIGLGVRVFFFGCRLSYGWMLGGMGLLDACWERMKKVWKTTEPDGGTSSGRSTRGLGEEEVAIVEPESKGLKPRMVDIPSVTADLSSFYNAASSSDGSLSHGRQDFSSSVDGSAELDAFWRDELSVVDIETTSPSPTVHSPSCLPEETFSFGTIALQNRMFDEMLSHSNSFFPGHQTTPSSTNPSVLEPFPFPPALSRSSSISSCSSWTSDPEPTTPTATGFQHEDFEEIEIGDVTIISNSTITLTNHSVEPVPMDWDTALAWINAACEVEPSPVLSPPSPVVVVSEPDQEPIYKPGYAWFEEDYVPVDQTRLGPFSVFNVTYDPLDQLYHYFADLDVVEEEEEEEEQEQEPMEDQQVLVHPSWGSSSSAWDATEDEEGYDQFGAMPDWMEGGEDPFSGA